MVRSVFGGSLESGGLFCVALGRNLASVSMKMFTYFIYFINFVLLMRHGKIMLQ